MTINDEKKSLSFNVIGYENDKNDDDYDWLMFRFEYSERNSIVEYYDPAMTADELIILTEKLQKMLSGEENVFFAYLIDDPAFRMTVIECHGEFAVAVYTEKYEQGERIHRYTIREIMKRERFESFISEITEETNKFPCRH